MTFDEVLAQVQELLQREQRVSYRGLKRRFALDDDYLEDLKEELIGAKRLAVDEDGRFLVWTGASPVSSSEFKVQGTANPDEVVISAATYHLVEGLFACEDRGQPELKGIATPPPQTTS